MLKSSSIIFLALIVTRLFGFLFNSLLTKTITQEEYGSYTFAWSIAQLGVGFLLLGIPSATAYHIAFNRGRGDMENVKGYLKTGFITVVILVFIYLFGLILINRLFPDIFSMNKQLILFMIFMFAIHGIGFFFSLVISGFRKPEIGTIFAVTTPIISYFSVLFLSYLGYGFYPILASIAASLAFQYLLCFGYVLKNWGLDGKFHPGLLRGLVKFGIPMIFMDVSNGLLWSSGVFVIKFYDSFANVGIFWAASMITGIMLMFPQAMLSIFSPVVSELFGKGDHKKIEHISTYIIERLLMFSLPLISILLLFPEGILRIVFTEDYTSGALAMQILSISAFLTGIYLFSGTLITTSGRPNLNSRIMFTGAIVNVVLNIILDRYYGINGASIAALLSSMIILALSFKLARRTIKLVIYRDRLTKILLSLVSALIIVYLIKIIFTNLILAFVISLIALPIIYFAIMLLLKTFREEDNVLIKSILGETKLSAPIIRIMEKGIS
jgi:O-antigen/teichoic acid export membrane protein